MQSARSVAHQRVGCAHITTRRSVASNEQRRLETRNGPRTVGGSSSLHRLLNPRFLLIWNPTQVTAVEPSCASAYCLCCPSGQKSCARNSCWVGWPMNGSKSWSKKCAMGTSCRSARPELKELAPRHPVAGELNGLLIELAKHDAIILRDEITHSLAPIKSAPPLCVFTLWGVDGKTLLAPRELKFLWPSGVNTKPSITTKELWPDALNKDSGCPHPVNRHGEAHRSDPTRWH